MSLSNPNSMFQVPLPAKYEELNQYQRKAVREHYMLLQRHNCWFCGDSLYNPAPKRITELPIDWDLFPPEFTKYPHHLQHDHSTGLTEGTVHSHCNAFMWHYFRR